jgi:hypothetical protein
LQTLHQRPGALCVVLLVQQQLGRRHDAQVRHFGLTLMGDHANAAPTVRPRKAFCVDLGQYVELRIGDSRCATAERDGLSPVHKLGYAVEAPARDGLEVVDLDFDRCTDLLFRKSRVQRCTHARVRHRVNDCAMYHPVRIEVVRPDEQAEPAVAGALLLDDEIDQLCEWMRDVQISDPRFAIPPSIVTIVPVV